MDSNIWLDILVFNDPYVQPLREALEAKTVVNWTSPSCYAELMRVLEYPRFQPYAINSAQALAWMLAHSQMLADEEQNAMPNLPICKDRDDQKFLELAYRCKADFLLSKDKALLKLAKRMERQFGIAVLLPQTFYQMVLSKI